MTARRLEVGTTPWNWRDLADAQELCAQAERAEAMGFHSFWLPENHFGNGAAVPAPLTLLAAVAARTRTLKLGCTSYLLPVRHPLLAAEEVAVLDRLSGGRLILGVGRGIRPDLFDAFGVAAADKRRIFARHLEIMRRAWRGEPVGEDATGAPIRLCPLPLQRPEPPVWVAAFGPLALAQVAALGLPYLASPLESLATLQANYRAFHDGVAAAGKPPVATVPVMRTVFVSRDPARVRALREALAAGVPANMRDRAGDVTEWAIVGERDAVRDRLGEYVERLNLGVLILRAGLPGVAEPEQLESHAEVLALARELQGAD